MDPLEIILKAYDILEKISGLLKPKKREVKKVLSEASIKQRSIFGDNNLILVSTGESKEHLISRLNDIPEDLLKEMKKQFVRKDLDPKKEGVRIVDSEFKKEITDYSRYFSKKTTIDSLFPLLEDRYKSILKLSIYIESLLATENHDMVKKIKFDIARQYGKIGTKLCKLYLTGYINKLNDYISNELSNIPKKKLPEITNSLIRDVLEESDYLFFIQKSDNHVRIAHKISNLMERNLPFIAVHSSGINVKKAKKILKIIEDDIEKFGYEKRRIKEPVKCPRCPIFYIGLIKRG